MESQTTLKNAKVLRKFDTYTFEKFDHPNGHKAFVLTDGVYTDYVIFYSTGRWAHDGIFRIRKDVKKYLDSLAVKMKGCKFSCINCANAFYNEGEDLHYCTITGKSKSVNSGCVRNYKEYYEFLRKYCDPMHYRPKGM